jgi:hypothetical protein
MDPENSDYNFCVRSKFTFEKSIKWGTLAQNIYIKCDLGTFTNVIFEKWYKVISIGSKTI